MYMNTTYSTKQSAVAMRKRMSDDTNKYNFNMKRILDRIREGSIPQQNTTKKYDISNAEVNAIRKEGNHPPLVVAFAPSAYAPTLAVNEETKRIQAQYLEQQQLTKNVKEDEQKLVQLFKKLMVEQRGKILKVPPGQQFAIKTFHDYVLYVRKIQPLLVENMIKIDERKLVYEEPEMIQTRSRVLEKRKREKEAKKKAKKGRVLVI